MARTKVGREAFLTARIPVELKEALDAEASASGRTMSQVAIQWMERARAERDVAGALGEATPIGDVFRRMMDFANDLQEAIGADPATDPYGREALIVGWQQLLPKVFPPASPSQEQMQEVHLQGRFREQAKGLLEKLRTLSEVQPDNSLVERLIAAPKVNLFARDLEGVEHQSTAQLLLAAAQPNSTVATFDRLIKSLAATLTEDEVEIEASGLSDEVQALLRAALDHTKVRAENSERIMRAIYVAEAIVRAMFSGEQLVPNLFYRGATPEGEPSH